VVNNPGYYTVCHYVNQDVFSNDAPEDMLYGNGNFDNYRVDQNCNLIRGWAKHTSTISGNHIPRHHPKPTLAMFHVDNIVSTCVGIEECVNNIPHSYIFLPPRKIWPKIFQERMVQLMEEEGEEFLENYNNRIHETDDDNEDEDEDSNDEDGDEEDEDNNEDDEDEENEDEDNDDDD